MKIASTILQVRETKNEAMGKVNAANNAANNGANNKSNSNTAVAQSAATKTDTVELSDRAVELFRVADTDTSSKGESTTNQDQEQVTADEAESISVLA